MRGVVGGQGGGQRSRRLEPARELKPLLDSYGSDKASKHRYHLVYADLLTRLGRHLPLRLLEIGLGTNDPSILLVDGGEWQAGCLRARLPRKVKEVVQRLDCVVVAVPPHDLRMKNDVLDAARRPAARPRPEYSTVVFGKRRPLMPRCQHVLARRLRGRRAPRGTLSRHTSLARARRRRRRRRARARPSRGRRGTRGRAGRRGRRGRRRRRRCRRPSTRRRPRTSRKRTTLKSNASSTVAARRAATAPSRARHYVSDRSKTRSRCGA